MMLVLPFIAMSQEALVKPWKFSGFTGLNLNQASFTNWTAGGVNSVAFSAFSKLYGDFKKDKISWTNNLNLMYGMVKEQDVNLKKSEDIIDLTSVLGYDLSKKWSFTGYVNFKTQFTDGYNKDNDTLRISTFMAPAYLTVSPAFRYKPVEWFSLFISPATAKFTMVMDQELADVGSFGVKPAEYDTNNVKIQDGENTLLYLGPFIEAYMKKEVAKNFGIESKLNILYTFLNRDNLEAYDMDMSWETTLIYKISKYFSATAFVHFVYFPGQPNISSDNFQAVKIPATYNRHIQVKETLGIGITYNFNTVKE